MQIRSPKIRLLVLLAAGLGAGFVNGFLGSGGGILLVFALGLAGIAPRERFAATIAVTLPLSALSAFLYGRHVDLSAALGYLLPALIGGCLGALFLDKISTALLKRIFGGLVLIAGIGLILR